MELIEDKSKKTKAKKVKEEPTLEEETQEKDPIDFAKLLAGAKEFMPGITDMFKPEKKDPSTMCEFTIKGSEKFVTDALNLILG